MSNVYDLAHDLAAELQQSEEYRNYIEAKKKIDATSIYKSRIQEFQKKQFEIEAKKRNGVQFSREEAQSLQELYGNLMVNGEIARYMHAEHRLSRMISDLYKIIGASVDLEIDFIE